MYTQCPECLAIYEIDEEALQASLGIVRCGRCSTRFDALRNLSDRLPEAPRRAWPEHDPAARAPTLTEQVSAFASETAKKPQAGSTGAASADPVAPPGMPADEDADDWFTGVASELAATSDARISDHPEPNPDDGSDWAVELPGAVGAAGTGIVAGGGAGTEDADAAPATEAPDDFAPAAADAGAPAFAHDDTGMVILPGTVPAPDSSADESGRPAPPSTPADSPTEDPEDDAALAASTATETEPSAAAADASTVPVYVRPRPRFSRRGLAWTLGCVLLTLLLAAQLAWANRVKLFRNQTTHGWMVRFCAHVPCRLPLIKDSAKLELLSRDVRPDPDAAGALTITATLRNDAAFSQPWPVVVVKFTDLDDNPVAMRRFRPAEYLPDSARRAAGIAPGETAAVAFEVVDPGKRATGFQFGFE